MTRPIRVWFIVIAFLMIFLAGQAFAFRCGTHLIREGDRRFDVMRKCGEPLSREQLGFTITADKKRELIIEEWVYGPENGFYTVLIFEGGILEEIKSIRE